MVEFLKRIPVWVIALSVLVLVALLAYQIIKGDARINAWGLQIDPVRTSISGVQAVPVGTIIASYLQPSQVKERYGDEWVLADGRDVSTNTPFFKETGMTKIPDLRGMFLRALNAGRNDGLGDPETRLLGSYQDDALKSHQHKISTGGIWGRSFKGEDAGPHTAYEKDANTGSFGGGETRPRNIAVYYYIKVN